MFGLNVTVNVKLFRRTSTSREQGLGALSDFFGALAHLAHMRTIWRAWLLFRLVSREHSLPQVVTRAIGIEHNAIHMNDRRTHKVYQKDQT